MVQKAVQNAVDREAGIAVKQATQDVVQNMTTEFQSRIRTAVTTAYDGLEATVADKLAKQVAALDDTKLKRDVVEKAKTAILNKFDENLEEYGRKLDSVGRIYEAVEAAVNKKPVKEMVFQIR